MQVESKLRVVLILAAMVVASTAANISLALRSGRLAVIPLYDDVVYLHDAYTRMSFGKSATIWDWAQSFFSNPPHSPLSTLTGMIGYSLIGPFVMAPYLANIWILGVYVAAIYLISRRSTGTAESLLISAIFLFAPVAHAMINEFRPDMGGGLLMALTLYLIVTTPLEDMTPVRRGILGLIAGLSVVAKPSAVVITIPLIGLASMISVAQVIYFGGSLGRAARALLLPTIAFLLVLVPFGLIWGPSTISYLAQALVTNADVWATPGGTLFHWEYHSFGEGGRLGLGPFLPAGLLIVAIDAIASLRTKRDRSSVPALSYYAILITIYIGMSIHSQKTLFQGSFFYIPFLVGVAMALTRRLAWAREQARTRKTVLLSLVATCLAAAILLPPATLFTNTASFAGTLPLRDLVVDEIDGRMARRSQEQCPERQLRFASLWPDPLNPDAVALAMEMKSGIRIDISGLYFERSADELLAKAMPQDFVFLPGSIQLKSNSSLPSAPYINEVAAKLIGSGLWSEVAMPRAMGDDPRMLVKKSCE